MKVKKLIPKGRIICCNGIFDSKDYDSFIDDVVGLFKYGYGVELSKSSEMEQLDVRGSINVYVHQNDAEIIQNLNASVVSKSLSRETASEIHPYATSSEKQRLEGEIEKEALSTGKIPINQNAEGMNDTNLQRQINAEAVE